MRSLVLFARPAPSLQLTKSCSRTPKAKVQVSEVGVGKDVTSIQFLDFGTLLSNLWKLAEFRRFSKRLPRDTTKRRLRDSGDQSDPGKISLMDIPTITK
ncbi:hypothetical protein L596_007454 [Steinernema carpocapsae]|uniref:Uncharacterized protein n=1 Tax=Steinernema carpocapsae TaxID=34508 RepID=A0A4U5P9B0_STECR|nr:hypothetical protein L596_007454 [Steinernema carpocapsae]